MNFERIIKTKPPFDKRSDNPKENYGIGSLILWFILKKGQKAVQVMINTNSYCQSTIKEYKTKHPDFLLETTDYEGYTCYDVGYHSNKPMYEGQTSYDCNLLKKGICYYDGSSLRGKYDKIAENYILNGDEWVWNYLKKEWNRLFKGSDSQK